MANVSLTITVSTEPGEHVDLAEVLRNLVGAKLASATWAPAADAPPVRFAIPFPVPVKARHTVTVNGVAREVPAAVARVVGKIAQGEREIRIRPELIDKLRLELPELLAGLHRDHERKVIDNAAAYRVAPFVIVNADGVESAECEPADAHEHETALRIQCPESPHPKHASQVVINGEMRTVPARVATVLAAIARGEPVVKYRPETAEALQELVPEIVPGLSRDWTRKVIGKHASYAVADWVREAFRE
jgi:hypothetical protein